MGESKNYGHSACAAIARFGRRWFTPLLVLLILATLAQPLARLHYVFDVASNFQVQFLVAGMILATILTASAAWRRAGVAAGATCVAAASVLPWHLPAPAPPPGEPLRIVLFNVYQHNTRFDDVVRMIQSLDADVAVLQEVHEEWYERLQPLTGAMPHAFHAPGGELRGMAMFSRHPLNLLRSIDFNNPMSPSIEATMTVNGIDVNLLALHPWPPVSIEAFRHRNDQLKLAAHYVARIERPVVVIGDLNTTMWSPYYRDFERVSGLRNVRKGYGVVATHPMNELPLLRVPIDHVLVSSDVGVSACRRGEPTGSDHAPLIADLVLPRTGGNVVPRSDDQ